MIDRKETSGNCLMCGHIKMAIIDNQTATTPDQYDDYTTLTCAVPGMVNDKNSISYSVCQVMLINATKPHLICYFFVSYMAKCGMNFDVLPLIPTVIPLLG